MKSRRRDGETVEQRQLDLFDRDPSAAQPDQPALATEAGVSDRRSTSADGSRASDSRSTGDGSRATETERKGSPGVAEPEPPGPPDAAESEPPGSPGAAQTASRGLPDAPARERIRRDLETNLLVEAGAGAGKTTELVNRMVALVRSGHTTVDHIAAVTFTRKAASELRERFQTLLEAELAASANAAVVVDKLDTALRDIDRAFIGTIHSFCARLLRARPLDAGLDPGFREVQAPEEMLLRRRYYDRHVERLAAEGDASLTRLDEVGLTTEQLFDVYSEIVGNPDVQFQTVEAPRPDAAPARDALEELLDAARLLLPREEPIKGWDGIQSAVRTLAFHRRVLPWHDDTHFLNLLAQTLSSTPQRTLNRWSEDRSIQQKVKDLHARFDAFCAPDGVGGSTIRAWLEHRHPVALGFARDAAAAFETERKRSGTLLFGDLLMHTARLLRGRPGARRELGERYRFLLVDEFQDTDPIQAEILFLLSSQSDASDWRTARPRAGALFVVGDPKQSIYRFRRADIALYESVKRRFNDFGDVIELTTNFRSTPPIGAFVNDVFESKFGVEGTQAQARFAPMRVARSSARRAGVVWHRLTPPRGAKGWKRAADIAQLDADRIASWIARRVASEEREPGDFLVLTRRNAFLPVYAQAIESRDLPVQVTGGGVTIETELAELRLLLSALADPGDERLTVAVLVGLFFGLDYEQLTQHVVDRKKRLSFLDVDRADSAVERALAMLNGFWRLSQREPADIMVSRIVEGLGLLPFAAAGELGDSRAGALLYVLDAARETARAGDASIGGVLAALDAAVETEEAEAQLEPGRADVVRVMNLHQAKGLESRVVILADPNQGRIPALTRYIDRSVDPARGFLVATEPRRFGGHTIIAQPVGWERLAAREQVFEDAERDRLLYVAATRAADELVVSCVDDPDRSPWGGFSPHLELACRRLELEVAAATEPEAPTFSVSDVEKEIADADTRRAARNPASYHARAVTRRVGAVPGIDVAKRGGSERDDIERNGPPLSPATVPEPVQMQRTHPRAADWGSAVHAALEATARGVRGDALRALCHAALLSNDRPLRADGKPRELDELVGVADAVRNAPFWPKVVRAREAGEVLIETPFAVRVTGDEYRSAMARLDADRGATGTGHEIAPVEVVEGVIDLAFREDDGWTIIDYKSDAAGAGTAAARRAHYRAQVGLYAVAWQRLSGDSVARRVVFYTADGSMDEW